MAFRAKRRRFIGLAGMLVAVWLLAGCDRTPEILESAPTPSGPPPNWAQQYLQAIPLYSVAGQPVTVTFNLYGADGCYRQSAAKTTVKGDRIRHQYKTWREGDVCTQAIVPGGFETAVTLTEPGTYRGEVLRDRQLVASYSLQVFPDETAATTAQQQALRTLSPWELTQVVKQVTQTPDRQLERALVPFITAYIVETDPEPLWQAIADWLQRTPHLDIIEIGRLALELPSGSGDLRDLETKQAILQRLAE